MISAKNLTCYMIRLAILGFLSIQTTPVAGNRPANSNLSQAQFLRRIRSPRSTEYVRQNCPACNEDISDTSKCSRKALMQHNQMTEDLQCKPQPTIVKLILPGPEYSLEPPISRVMRCGGYCKHGHTSCLPVQTSFVKIPAILTHHRNAKTKCVEFEVEQHDECTCECKIKEEQCSEKHRHKHCLCKCINEAEMIQCLEGKLDPKRVWLEEKCECVCEPELCLRGYVWDLEKCRCEMFSRIPDDLENMLY